MGKLNNDEHKTLENKIRTEMLETLSDDLNSFAGAKISCIKTNGVDILQGGEWYTYDDGYFILIAKSTLGIKSHFKPRYNICKKPNKGIVRKKVSKEIKCAECGNVFHATHRSLYCSKECRVAKNKRANREARGSMALSEVEKCIIKTKRSIARQEDEKIMACSVACLIKELGDIE